MAEVRDRGLVAARHLEDEIWEVRVDGDRVIYRIRSPRRSPPAGGCCSHSRGFKRKTQQTPRATIELANQRLSDWRRPSAAQRAAQGRRPLS